jgi:hypothetical protein
VTVRAPNPRLAPGAHSDPEAATANKRSSRLCSFRRDALVAHDPERNLDLRSGAEELLKVFADGQFIWSGKFSLARSEF